MGLEEFCHMDGHNVQLHMDGLGLAKTLGSMRQWFVSGFANHVPLRC